MSVFVRRCVNCKYRTGSGCDKKMDANVPKSKRKNNFLCDKWAMKIPKAAMRPAKRDRAGWRKVHLALDRKIGGYLKSCGVNLSELWHAIRKDLELGWLRLNDVAEVCHGIGCTFEGCDKPYSSWIPNGSEIVKPPARTD